MPSDKELQDSEDQINELIELIWPRLDAGESEAIAEPLKNGWQFWLVRTSDGETIAEELCAS